MVTTVAKRIQSRLSRQGLKVPLGEIKTVYSQMVVDPEKPTDVEVNSVFEHFMDNATKLVVITDEVEPPTTEVEETFICVGGESGNIEPTIMGETETFNQDIEELSAVSISQHKVEEVSLSVQNKSELVTSTAANLGIALNTQEIELIAENVNTSSDDLTDSLEEIKAAILSFVRHKIALNSQKIDETLEEITQVATDGFNQNSQQLTEGLQQINQQLQQQTKDFKSKVKSVLGAFAVPSIKAG